MQTTLLKDRILYNEFGTGRCSVIFFLTAVKARAARKRSVLSHDRLTKGKHVSKLSQSSLPGLQTTIFSLPPRKPFLPKSC